MKIALIQMQVKSCPDENIVIIKSFIQKAKSAGADLVLFPEMCACPYDNESFLRYAMEKDDHFLTEIGSAAKEEGIFVVAGSVPERKKKKIYNTSFVFFPNGSMITGHRKMHLFDINVEGGQQFQESATFSAGDSLSTFSTPWGTLGLIICYDIRFPELSRLLALKGAKGILVPAAFNMTTGPAHWQLSFQARSLDNQVFMAGVSPARDNNASYVSYGHSISTDPWGQVILEMDEKEGMEIVEWDMAKLEKVREELPLLKHRRTNCYQVVEPSFGIGTEPLEYQIEEKDRAKKKK